jgi:hypothetical protein
VISKKKMNLICIRFILNEKLFIFRLKIKNQKLFLCFKKRKVTEKVLEKKYN